jgi:hypothetical protein
MSLTQMNFFHYNQTMQSVSSNPDEQIKSTIQEILSEWSLIGVITNGQEFPKLVMPDGIPDRPGVYRIFCPVSKKCYVGESQLLKNRLKDYENAGYIPGEAANTNRTVQGVIAEMIRSNDSEFQVWCCTSAKIRDKKFEQLDLDLSQRYFRTLIEAITIAGDPALIYINKQYKNRNLDEFADF